MERYEKAVKPQRCPTCGNAITQSTDLLDKDARLDPGDFAICDQCGGFLILGSDHVLSAVTDEAVRHDPRFSPRSIAWLFEAQRAVRARARLLVTTDETGERTVQMVSQPEGRKPYYGKN